jgi:hypothetical protein
MELEAAWKVLHDAGVRAIADISLGCLQDIVNGSPHYSDAERRLAAGLIEVRAAAEAAPAVEVPIVAGPEIVKRVRVTTEIDSDLLVVAHDLVEQSVADGSGCEDPTLACLCHVCRAIRVLVAIEGPGRCVICGCDEDHACYGGCGWADETRTVCNRHPAEDVATARLVLAQEAEHG